MGEKNRLEIRLLNLCLFGDHRWDRRNVLTQAEILEKAAQAGPDRFGPRRNRLLPASTLTAGMEVWRYSLCNGSLLRPLFAERITADGKFRNCTVCPEETDLRGPLRAECRG